jgi:hypothetical protein
MPRDNNKKNYLVVPKPTVVTTPTFGQSIKDGIGLGIGNSLARHMIDSFFKRLESPTQVFDKCNVERVEFENCLRTNSSCENKQYILQECLQK